MLYANWAKPQSGSRQRSAPRRQLKGSRKNGFRELALGFRLDLPGDPDLGAHAHLLAKTSECAMKKKDKDDILRDYQKLKNEIISDKVAEIFRTHPDNYISELEKIGFKYYDDDDTEEIEERNAQPKNQNQWDLVEYLEGDGEFSETILVTFFEEKDAEEPNLPLIRKYFKQANQNLKFLILYGLDHYPARIDLLADLAYFHEFENMLSTLIKYFTQACMNQMNLETFTELAQDFYYATLPDGDEALYALRDLFEPKSNKREIIDFLIQETEDSENSSSVEEFWKFCHPQDTDIVTRRF